MTKAEVRTAIKDSTPMVWDDPDPIKGNDYTVQEIYITSDETALIHYGSDDQEMYSEAEVYLHELSFKTERR